MNHKIKPNPCPFCKCEKITFIECEIKEIGKKVYWLRCGNCGATGPLGPSEESAAKSWGFVWRDLDPFDEAMLLKIYQANADA